MAYTNSFRNVFKYAKFFLIVSAMLIFSIFLPYTIIFWNLSLVHPSRVVVPLDDSDSELNRSTRVNCYKIYEDCDTAASQPEKLLISSDVIYANISDGLESRIRLRIFRAREYRKRMEQKFIFNKVISDPAQQPLFVTISAPGGGLGNYMFFTAALFGIARQNHRIPISIRNDDRKNYFEGLTLELVNETQILGSHTLAESWMRTSGPAKYTPSTSNLTATIFANRTVVLTGFLQSWMYFNKFRDEIRTMFTFKAPTLQLAKLAILQGLRDLSNRKNTLNNLNKMPTLVGIHVRRGDILAKKHIAIGWTVATDQYLLRMVIRYQRKYHPVIFFVISNDIKYCKQLFLEDNFVFLGPKNPLEVDMSVMTLMDQVIMSVGTYSFWGAYLNSEATDISYFKDWPMKGSWLANQTNSADYFLPTWNGYW